jgi:hypothetical protein
MSRPNWPNSPPDKFADNCLAQTPPATPPASPPPRNAAAASTAMVDSPVHTPPPRVTLTPLMRRRSPLAPLMDNHTRPRDGEDSDDSDAEMQTINAKINELAEHLEKAGVLNDASPWKVDMDADNESILLSLYNPQTMIRRAALRPPPRTRTPSPDAVTNLIAQ